MTRGADGYSIGFWHALYTLDEGNYTVWDIAKYMTNIWFGLDSSGFDKSREWLTLRFGTAHSGRQAKRWA